MHCTRNSQLYGLPWLDNHSSRDVVMIRVLKKELSNENLLNICYTKVNNFRVEGIVLENRGEIYCPSYLIFLDQGRSHVEG